MSKRHRSIALLAFIVAVATLVLVFAPAALATPHQSLVVSPSNSPYVVSDTTFVKRLVIQQGGWIVAPAGKAVTLTVKGVEMGGVLESTNGTATLLSKAGVYCDALLTVTAESPFVYAPQGPPGVPAPTYTFPFRQALYLDATGVVASKSVFAAVKGPRPVAGLVKNATIVSKGENFNGIFVAGGTWNIKNATIRMNGNGRSDFVGYGAGVVVNGETTKLVIDRRQHRDPGRRPGGRRRRGWRERGGQELVHRDQERRSALRLRPDHRHGAQMRSVPWMLSLSGNVRATNLLGTNTKASYINSTIRSQGWGVLSTDGCTTPTLTAINSKIEITGKDGYGSYGIGDATENFLGSTFNVASYATISRGSFLFFGDSTPAAVAALNTSLGLGLSRQELRGHPRTGRPWSTPSGSASCGTAAARWTSPAARCSTPRRPPSSTRARPSPSRSTAPRAPGSNRLTASSCRSWTMTIRVRTSPPCRTPRPTSSRRSRPRRSTLGI